MTDHRSPEEIEREIERERAGLTNTIEDLQDRFSIEGVVRQISDQLREHGGDIGSAVSRSVKDNPMALALTGIGLAWMIFGSGDKNESARGYRGDRRTSRDDDRTWDAASRDGRQHDSRPGRGRGMSESETPNWVRSYDSSHGRQDGQTFGSKASGAGQAVSEATGRAGESLHDAGASVAEGMRGARDKVSDMAGQAADRATDLRERLSEGVESLSDEARERVIAARERAMEARDAAVDYARQGRDKVVDLFEEQPLIAGALAVAVGAAIGAALPRTRTEDRYFGEQRDDLIAEAERIFAEERAKVEKVGRAVMDEAKDAIGEVKHTGQRIADAAKEEAERQALGKPSL